MATFTKVAKTSEIPTNSGKTVSVGGRDSAVFNVEGSFYAIDNTCLHRGGPLGGGLKAGRYFLNYRIGLRGTGRTRRER